MHWQRRGVRRTLTTAATSGRVGEKRYADVIDVITSPCTISVANPRT